MKFLFFSGGGDGLGLALRLAQEDNEVGVWIREKACKQNYDGLLRKVDDWNDFLDKDTISIFDSNGGGRTADRLRARGHFVCTGGTFADQLEFDRPLAFELMQQGGVRLPTYKEFTSWDKARVWVKERGKRLAFKPSGETAKELGSYLAYDAADMLEMIDMWQERVKGKPEFLLQDFVEGVEISSEGWFNGERFMRPFNHTIESKKLMNEDLGASYGCAGNIVWTQEDPTPVIEQGILLMEDLLREHEYLGPIDLNTICNEEGVWGLEFTPRFGYDAMPALLELFDQPVGQTLASLARMEHPSRLPMSTVPNTFASALKLSIPPYGSELRAKEGIPVRGFVRSDKPHLFFGDVMLNEKLQLVSTAAYGSLITLTGKGDDITSAFKGPMELAEKAKIPNKQYRTDLVSTFVTHRDKLDQYLNIKEPSLVTTT